eukprot:scaffold21741_cov62-Phaeocystis_antarctica.AAC.2
MVGGGGVGGGAAALLCSRNSRPAAFLLSLSSSERGGRRDCRAAWEPESVSMLVHESRPRASASGISTLASVAAYASCDAVSGRADQSDVCSVLFTAIDSRLSHAAPSPTTVRFGKPRVRVAPFCGSKSASAPPVAPGSAASIRLRSSCMAKPSLETVGARITRRTIDCSKRARAGSREIAIIAKIPK